jgi:hypothetical protein
MSLADAYRDLKYLLNRGYPKKSALKFVADHYRLPLRERYLLARCVFPDEWIIEVRRKLLEPGELAGKTLAVDGFNVLITLESVLDGEAILCEDGLVRDLKYQGKYRLNERTPEVVETVVKSLSVLGVSKAIFFYGKNVPKSGIVGKMTKEAMEKYGLSGNVRLVKSPDFELKAFETVATADVGIVSKVEHVFDIPCYLSAKLGIKVKGIFDLFQSERC